MATYKRRIKFYGERELRAVSQAAMLRRMPMDEFNRLAILAYANRTYRTHARMMFIDRLLLGPARRRVWGWLTRRKRVAA